MFRHVVVVAIEGARADPGLLSDAGQLIQRCVGDQVGEHSAVRRPHRGINVDAHLNQSMSLGQLTVDGGKVAPWIFDTWETAA